MPRKGHASNVPHQVAAPVYPQQPAAKHEVAITTPHLVKEIAPVQLPLPAKVGDPATAPTTTEEEQRATVGQRRVNLIWESTQAILAILVTAATLYVAGVLSLKEPGSEAAFLLLSNAFFSVITYYLARTNHTRTGGVKPGDVGR